jgi:DNA-binding response OmpR family regulator
MKWTLIYFDDQQANIECFSELLAEDFNVIGCLDASKYSDLLTHHYPHAILLDVHMPVLDGHTLYKKISEHPLYNDCPVIFISGDQSDENKIKSYEGGGIDFLSRNIKTEEISARLTSKIKFFLARSTNLELGNLEVDVSTMKATIEGKTLDLTLLELRILSHILRTFPQNLTRQGLIKKVWGNEIVKPGTINTHLTNLKPKIESWDHQIKVREENLLVMKKEN